MKNKNYEFIDNLKRVNEIVSQVLYNQKIISIDCEGIKLSKTGSLTLIQIGLYNKQGYLFDVKILSKSLFEGRNSLKTILENEKILKILHGCRNDYESLYYQYKIKLNNFIDTQEMNFIYEGIKYNSFYRISLKELIKKILNVDLSLKDKVHNIMNNNFLIWDERPIKNEYLEYSYEDIKYLIDLYYELKKLLNDNEYYISKKLTIFQFTNRKLYYDFKNFIRNMVIKNKNNKYENIRNIDFYNLYFSNDEKKIEKKNIKKELIKKNNNKNIIIFIFISFNIFLIMLLKIITIFDW